MQATYGYHQVLRATMHDQQFRHFRSGVEPQRVEAETSTLTAGQTPDSSCGSEAVEQKFEMAVPFSSILTGLFLHTGHFMADPSWALWEFYLHGDCIGSKLNVFQFWIAWGQDSDRHVVNISQHQFERSNSWMLCWDEQLVPRNSMEFPEINPLPHHGMTTIPTMHGAIPWHWPPLVASCWGFSHGVARCTAFGSATFQARMNRMYEPVSSGLSLVNEPYSDQW